MALTDKLVAIADALRSKTGGTDKLTLDQIATGISGLDTSDSSGSAVPEIAKYWSVGTWTEGGTTAEATTSRAYLAKKMASGVSITNNTGAAFNVVGVSFDSDGKVTAISSAKRVTKGGNITLTDNSAHHLYVLIYSTISVFGTTSELQLNAKGLLNYAQGVTITGTEVS